MAETFVLSFVDKLMLLEKQAGSGVGYSIMAPVSSSPHDVISLQRLAHHIAKSIGLGHIHFIIATAKQKANVGGHVDLGTTGDDVFIEIDPDTTQFPEAVAATLCHEICHKWLQLKGISSPIKMDNEILTDITTVFLGFGKIMLNGCELEKVTEQRTPEGTQVRTQRLKSGYLMRDQFAFVYRMVCAMRNVPVSEYTAGLTPAAQAALCDCDRQHERYYSAKFHRTESGAAALSDLQAETTARRKQIAQLNKHLDYVKQSFCETVEKSLAASHATVEELSRKASTLLQETHPDPALRFLLAVRREHELDKMSKEFVKVRTALHDLLADAAVLGRHLWQNSQRFPRPAPKMFNIVKCPKDGTKLRLPEDSADLTVVCPTCHYRFAYDTTCVSFEQPALKVQKPRPPSKPPPERPPREGVEQSSNLGRFFARMRNQSKP